MEEFAELIDRLTYTRSRNAKIALIAAYLRETPDPDRGWALAALTGALDLAAVKSSQIRAMAEERVDPVLFAMSRDYVGDTAETVALMWPEPAPRSPAKAGAHHLGSPAETTGSKGVKPRDGPLPTQGNEGTPQPSLDEIVTALATTTRASAPALVAGYMDRLDADGRYAFLKLATGAMRVGISARLAKTGFAQAFGMEADAVEEVWHALSPPYAELFAWGEGRGPRPDPEGVPFFRPFMLAHPLEELEVDLADYAAEWKWDGIRVQIVGIGGVVRLYSRGGDDITSAFPEIAEAFDAVGVVDGELLVKGDVQGGPETQGGAASFNALQQRLGRKVVSTKMRSDYPAFVRLYDILIDGQEDVRELPWEARRARLAAFVPRLDPDRFDLSTLLDATDFAHLGEIRAGARDAAIEGVMLKRRDSPYVPGRRTGLWYKWKRDPLTADCVMMYAQRGSGKRSSFYSDYTFGCWTDEGELLPVGKAYSGFTDEELKGLDRFVRQNTVKRFGPVREVEKTLVLEVAFDSIHASKRHKSGLAMRFPRIHRIRTDKPAEEADRIATLLAIAT